VAKRWNSGDKRWEEFEEEPCGPKLPGTPDVPVFEGRKGDATGGNVHDTGIDWSLT
jgi:hypothetical protein